MSFEPKFVALMQIYLTSHAIHQAKDAELAARIRAAYSDINQRYNATIVCGDKAEDPAALDVYERELRERVPDLRGTVELTADRVWDAVGYLGDLTAAQVTSGTHDDRVVRYCFAAQVLYAAQETDDDRDQVAMSILRGDVSKGLRADLREYVTAVIEALRECPDYEFRVYWGFTESRHLAHIVAPDARYYWFDVFRHAPQRIRRKSTPRGRNEFRNPAFPAAVDKGVQPWQAHVLFEAVAHQVPEATRIDMAEVKPRMPKLPEILGIVLRMVYFEPGGYHKIA